VGEHHAGRVALGAEPRDDLDALGGGQEVLEAEAIHPDGAAPLHEAAQVAEILAVAAVADDHAAKIHALLGEDRLLRLPAAAGGPGVRGDRHAGRLLGPRGGAQDVLDDGRHSRGVGGALDDGRLHPARADAPGDVADEEIGDRADAVRAEVALRHPPHAGGHDHVHPGAAGDREDQIDVAAQIDGGQVDDGPDPAGVEIGHLPLRGLQDGRPVPQMGPVLLHPGRAGDDVLVHQRGAELGRGHRAERCLHRGHADLPERVWVRAPRYPATARTKRSTSVSSL
jgi:hypothetical protein